MTDFMQRIDDLLHDDPQALRAPKLVDPTEKSTGQGAHAQVEIRSYAEQLLSEANAVLVPVTGKSIALEDRSGTLDQVFTIAYGHAWAQLATRFHHGKARSELISSSLGRTDRQLLDSDALEDLIVTLVADEAVTANQVEGVLR